MPTPEGRVLLVTQKNQLYLGLELRGYSPANDFSLEEHEYDGLAILRHKKAGYIFSVHVGKDHDTGEEYWEIHLSPGQSRLHESLRVHSWNKVLEGFNHWLECLDAQLQSPDLWSTVSGDTSLTELAADQDNQSFSSNDQLQVKKALSEIKAYLIKSHDLTEAQTRTVEARFNYMEEAAGRLGRKDWTGIFVTGLIGIATTLALSADSAKDLIRFSGKIVKQLLGTALYLAGPH